MHYGAKFKFYVLWGVMCLLPLEFAWSQNSGEPTGDSKVAVGSTGSTEEVLNDVRLLIRQRHYRAAEQMLLRRLNTLTAPPALESLEAALGEVYFHSGQDEKAVAWLHRSQVHYEQISPLTLELLKEECHVADLLADSYSNQGQTAAAVTTLQRMYAHYNRQETIDLPEQMDLVSHLAELGAAKLGPAPSAPSVNGEMDWLEHRLHADFQQHSLTLSDYAQGVVSLAKYQQAIKRQDLAANSLEQLIEMELNDSSQKASRILSLRLQLADIYRQSNKFGEEIDTLQAALKGRRELLSSSLDDNHGAQPGLRQRYDLAEMERLLADALFRDGRQSDCADQLVLAVQDYKSALAQASLPREANTNVADLTETMLLERLVDVSDRLLELPKVTSLSLDDTIVWHEKLLVQDEQSLLSSDPRISSLKVSLASLYVENSQFDPAREKLVEARNFWEQQRPPNNTMLVQTLNLLTECDLAAASESSLQEAAAVLTEATKICGALPPDDESRWWVHLNSGRLKAAQGQYQQALGELEQIVTDPLNRQLSAKLRSLALLNLSLLYKEQLKLDESVQLCREALTLRQLELPADHPEMLRYYLALGELQIARHDAVALQDVVQKQEVICNRLSADHPSRIASLNQKAMVHYLIDEASSDVDQRQAARIIWEQLAATCRQTDQRALEARALHYLARLDYLDWTAQTKAWNDLVQANNFAPQQATWKGMKAQIDKYNARQQQYELARQDYRRASERYDQSADELLETRQQVFQSLQRQFESLQQEKQNLSDLAAQLRDREKELSQLHDEPAPLNHTEIKNDRKDWQEKLVHGQKLAAEAIRLLREAGIYPSLHHAALCNYAQILQAESQLGDTKDEQLLQRALVALQEAVEVIEDPRSATFGGDFLRAEFFAQYQSAFDLKVQFHVQAGQLIDALVAAEQGRSRTLLDQLWPDKLSHSFPAERARQLVERWRTSDSPLLYYYVGETKSYLFVLGCAQHQIQVFPLKQEPGLDNWNHNNDVSATNVASNVALLRASFGDERNASSALFNPTIKQKLAAASAVLMPSEVVDYLRQEKNLAASYVTVIPHGALVQLPLETLIVADDEEHPYLVDCSPPLVYAPSLMLLDDLQHRPTSPTVAPTLLTVGNPDYSHATSENGPDRKFLPLPESEFESQQIARFFSNRFGENRVVVLTGDTARESRFREAIARCRFTYLHLAAHGIMGDDRGQPFGRMVLTPSLELPAPKDDDGFLDLDEIRSLGLAGCELAVLSACDTNIGALVARYNQKTNGHSSLPSAYLENALRLSQTDTCFSLASAFLTAGSRRVLATQWEVADPSTRVFVSLLFDKLTRELNTGHLLNYAELLAECRQQLRSAHPEFNTPFHWAPFVLIGPPESTTVPQ